MLSEFLKWCFWRLRIGMIIKSMPRSLAEYILGKPHYTQGIGGKNKYPRYTYRHDSRWFVGHCIVEYTKTSVVNKTSNGYYPAIKQAKKSMDSFRQRPLMHTIKLNTESLNKTMKQIVGNVLCFLRYPKSPEMQQLAKLKVIPLDLSEMASQYEPKYAAHGTVSSFRPKAVTCSMKDAAKVLDDLKSKGFRITYTGSGVRALVERSTYRIGWNFTRVGKDNIAYYDFREEWD